MSLYVTDRLFPNMYAVCCAFLEARGDGIPEKIDMPDMVTYEVLGLAEDGLSKLTKSEQRELHLTVDKISTLLFIHPGVCVAVMILHLVVHEVM